jgi:LPS-assembly lipoprotein
MMKRQLELLIVVLLLILSACGFHLRGNLAFPPDFQHLYVKLPPDHKSFKYKLKDKLRSFRVQPHASLQHTCYQLVIDELKFNRQIANISSSTTPRQFQLSYTVFYHFLSPQGDLLIPKAFLIANRLVSMNNERLLGSNYEQDFFKDEMEDELINKLLMTLPPAMTMMQR